MMSFETVKKEVITEYELQHFSDSLASSLTSKFQFTIDYFDASTESLDDIEAPSLSKFCVALLKEILCNLKPNHELWDKIKYAAFLLNLATRNIDFGLLYEIYHQIELEVSNRNLRWRDHEIRKCIEEKIAEKFVVKDDVCSLPDLDFDSKNDFEFDNSIYTGNNLNLLQLKDAEDDYGDFADVDDYLEIGKEEVGMDNDCPNWLVDETKPLKKKPQTKRKNKNIKKEIKSEVPKEAKKPRVKKRKEMSDEDQDDDFVPNAEEEHEFRHEDKYKEEDKTRLPCLLCNHKAKNSQELERHSFEKHKANRLCIQCGHLSNTYQDFSRHNETHLYTCEVCQEKLLGLRKLRAHMKLHETKQEATSPQEEAKKVTCDVCGILLMACSLRVHMSEVHSDEIHKCDMCDFTSNTKMKIACHRKRHFVKMSKCPECGKIVKCLKKHYERNCAGDKVRHYCNLCEKSFSMKQGLARHIKHIHQKITDYHCQLCDYKTYTNFNLKLHISKMHTKEDMEKICPFCNQKTNSLDYHIKIYHMDDKFKSQANGGNIENPEDDKKVEDS